MFTPSRIPWSRGLMVMLAPAMLGLAAQSVAVAADQQTKTAVPQRQPLPKGFIRLRDVDPTIEVEMRYAAADNFVGRRVDGYMANTCILAKPLARALARVQQKLAAGGIGLRVYDCYRPRRAVRHFVRWAKGRDGERPTKHYYPRITRHQIIPLGYVAERSSHSRGTAVDLTLVRRTTQAAVPALAGAKLPQNCTEVTAANLAGQELDMGTRWDCFDELSHTHHNAISPTATVNRQRLLRAMKAEGFRNYKREWWHFSLAAPGFTRARDFPVK